ncbi:alpha-aminoadipate carrier protein LysW [Amycolatopsis australiensis]|uniref:Alpha-aminoadipate carrier protein LysW n=2 Tax=Amycolatopsis australiensis TaxID=546364 RepID=A0A1K1SQR1_9PSEU|nr:alpha-aminoadipate carrier protein LysW [Amycolatopsis australiensis]
MMELTGTCPECETKLAVSDLTVGETFTCPECVLTLRINAVEDGVLVLEMVEKQLRDWGQ